MNCKNCQHTLEQDALFCDYCGAKVIKNRITLKFLLSELFARVFGLDNKYFITLKKMLIAPQEVLEGYVNGVRKRYVNPISFFALGLTISLFLLNYFADHFVNINLDSAKNQFEIISSFENKLGVNSMSEEEFIKNTKKSTEFTVRYMNLISFLLLPFYALISYIVYRKPYNYAEHLVINTYLSGFAFVLSTIAFLISLVTTPSIYYYGTFLFLLYYPYAYGKLYKLGFWEAVLKLLILLGLFLVGFIIIFIISILVGFLFAVFS